MLAAVLLALFQDRIVGEDPARAKWDEIMQYLRAGGGFDDPKRPEGMAFAKVKNMGEGAYPYLISYIDHEDIMLCRAAVKVLNELTGSEEPLPREDTKANHKARWEKLILQHRPLPRAAPEVLALLECEIPEPDVRTLIENLSDDDPAVRRKANATLRTCVLRHEALLRRSRTEARDAETAGRLDELLAYRESMEAGLNRIRAHPDILLCDVLPGSPLEARRKALVEEIRASRPASFLGMNRVEMDRSPSWSDEMRRQWAAAASEKRAVDTGVIERLEQLARQDLDRLGKKATLLVEEGKKSEGLEILKAARPRFELTGSAVALQKLIEELDR